MNYEKNDIDNLLNNIDLVELITGDKGNKTKDGYYLIKCPFEKEPEKEGFLIDINRNSYSCLDCGKSGNAITFMMDYYGMNIEQAIKELSKIANVTIKKKNDYNKDIEEERKFFLKYTKLTTEYYQKQLSIENNPCTAYIEKRGILEKDVEKFKLGYSGPFNDSLFNYLIDKGMDREKLISSGFFSEKKERKNTIYYDKLYNRMVCPIFDVHGTAIGFSARTLGKSRAKYINTPENDIFHKGENLYGLNFALKTKKDYLILCEGNVDVITMHSHGFENSAASCGTALTAEQIKLISQHYNKVILAYDNDPAGKQATYKAIKLFHLISPDSEIKVVNISPHKDPDEFINNKGKEKFEVRINHSISSDEFIDLYIKELDKEDDKINLIVENLLEEGEYYEI